MFKDEYKKDNDLINPSPVSVDALLLKMRAEAAKPHISMKKLAYSLGTLAACAAIVICCVTLLPSLNNAPSMVDKANAEAGVIETPADSTAGNAEEAVVDGAAGMEDGAFDAEYAADESNDEFVIQGFAAVPSATAAAGTDNGAPESESNADDSVTVTDETNNNDNALTNALPETNECEEECADEPIADMPPLMSSNPDTSDNDTTEAATEIKDSAAPTDDECAEAIEEPCAESQPSNKEATNDCDNEETCEETCEETYEETCDENPTVGWGSENAIENSLSALAQTVLNGEFNVALNGKDYVSVISEEPAESPLLHNGKIVTVQTLSAAGTEDYINFTFYELDGVSPDYMLLGYNSETDVCRFFTRKPKQLRTLDGDAVNALVDLEKTVSEFTFAESMRLPSDERLIMAVYGISNGKTVAKPKDTKSYKLVLYSDYLPEIEFLIYENGLVRYPYNERYYKLSDSAFSLFREYSDGIM